MSNQKFKEHLRSAYTDIMERQPFGAPASRREALYKIEELKAKVGEIQSKLNDKDKERDFHTGWEYRKWRKDAGTALFFAHIEIMFLKKYNELMELKKNFGDSVLDLFGPGPKKY